MSGLLDELQLASRRLVRRPRLAIFVVSCLALCIGASTAVFSVAQAAFLQPLSFVEPDRLVVVSERRP